MKILFLGDIVGRCGREAVFSRLYDLKEKYNIDVCIANVENASGGFGINKDAAEELSRAGIDVFTTGNHVFSKKDVLQMFDNYNIVRPYNFPEKDPGVGYVAFTAKNGEKVAVINLIGRLYIDLPVSNPFLAADEALSKIEAKHIFVDFHAEATSEKKAFGFYLRGRVSGIFGTHTHVQTSDETILEGGTAYITDAGMCGAVDSVLGADPKMAISRFTSAVKCQYEGAKGKSEVCGLFVETDENGKAVKIERIKLS